MEDKQAAEMMARAREHFARRRPPRWWEKLPKANSMSAVISRTACILQAYTAVHHLFTDIEAAMRRQMARRMRQQG